MIRSPLTELRIAIRSNVKMVMHFIKKNYVIRINDTAVSPSKNLICFFCGSKNPITKEHIIPRWIFEKDTSRYFNIILNAHSQTYNKSTVPACQKCNAERLNFLERIIQTVFQNSSLSQNGFDLAECENVIRWLEVIDYKFQVMNISKKFLSPRNGNHVDYLKDFPLYMLLYNKDYSPSKVLSEIRFTLLRISVKSKLERINSLVIFKSKNKGDYFFHTLNEYIFFELPKYGLAIFYFYIRDFETNKEAYDAAMKIIKNIYES